MFPQVPMPVLVVLGSKPKGGVYAARMTSFVVPRCMDDLPDSTVMLTASTAVFANIAVLRLDLQLLYSGIYAQSCPHSVKHKVEAP